MNKKVIFIYTSVPDDAAIRKQLGLVAFHTVVAPTCSLQGRIFEVASHFEYEVVFIENESLPTLQELRLRDQENPTSIHMSAGLAAADPLAAEDLLAALVKLSATEESWLVQRDRFESNSTVIKHGLSLSDLGLPTEDFDFSLLASKPRFFNHLEFDGKRVRKLTKWTQKGKAEATFYRLIPEPLSGFFPQLIKEIDEPDAHVYELEQKKWFDMGRHAIQDSFNAQDWSNFERGLRSYFDKLPRVTAGPERVKSEMQRYFIEKLDERLTQFLHDPVSIAMRAQFRRDVGADFEARTGELRERIERSLKLYNGNSLVFSHGDLCLSNILFNREGAELCLIDPRGVIDSSDLYRPEDYDLAKLAQSLDGNYEFILNHRVPSDQWRNNASRLLANWLESRGRSMEDIRVYVASLYWSLLPLHVDQPARAYRFMLEGEAYLSKVS